MSSNNKHRYGLSIGCTYIQRGISNITLNGTYNDAINMKHLMEIYGYEVVIMNDVDYTSNNELYPTMQNILKQLQIILSRAKSGDDVFIYYAGHGVQLLKNILISDVDNYAVKTTGVDEAIVPVNFGFGGDTGFINVIVDATINQFIRDFGRSKVKILLVFDCCHSGTVCNLKYSYSYSGAALNGIVYDAAPDQSIDKSKPIRCDVITISACQDNEVSAEDVIRFNKSENEQEQGVLTGSLRYVLQSNPNIVNDVFNILKAIMSYTTKYSQHPKISSNMPLHLDSSYRAILTATDKISNITDSINKFKYFDGNKINRDNNSIVTQLRVADLTNSISLFGPNMNTMSQITKNTQIENVQIKNTSQLTQSIYNTISIKNIDLTKFLV